MAEDGDREKPEPGPAPRAPESLSAREVLGSSKMDDEGKFASLRSLVEAGKLANKEVVNSVLHLVSRSGPSR
jgi:hypothetical protein